MKEYENVNHKQTKFNTRDLKCAIPFSLFKEGDRLMCDNYKGIAYSHHLPR